MTSWEFGNRNEQLDAQIAKALSTYPKAMEFFCTSPKTEITFLQNIQLFCYEDARFMKFFRSIITNLYKHDVVSEAAILYWFEKGATSQGKAIFVKQMEPFIDWLKKQEDDDDDEEDG